MLDLFYKIYHIQVIVNFHLLNVKISTSNIKLENYINGFFVFELLLGCFHIFLDSTHNVSLQKEVADLWHAKESKANVGIRSFTRHVTLKDWDEFQYVLIPCTNLACMCCNLFFLKHLKLNLNQMFINQTTFSLP
jgi:hypothetical protein